MPKVLIISHNEICYNARLLKAADVFQDQGWEVDVFNAVTGIASADVYRDIVQNRSWNVIENDISKRSFSSKIKWFVNGLLFKAVKVSVEKLKLKTWNDYYLNKGLILKPSLANKKYDLLIVHLIDNLPFAVKLKKQIGAKLVYDSQEYFVGQYAAFKKSEYQWVMENEKKYIHDVDILLSTTNVMLKRIVEDYNLNIPSFRVRNVPSIKAKGNIEPFRDDEEAETPIKLVWHGMAIYFNNRRGVHIILKAVAECKANVVLYLQGNFPEDQKLIFEQYCKEYSLEDRVVIKPSAKPDQIVKSLLEYDIGITAELPEEENQELTSSNKLFDYINAGLAVISSDVLGLAETIDEYEVGRKYTPGDFKKLSNIIDELALNPSQLSEYKKNSLKAAEVLYWENDYKPVLNKVKQII